MTQVTGSIVIHATVAFSGSIGSSKPTAPISRSALHDHDVLQQESMSALPELL